MRYSLKHLLGAFAFVSMLAGLLVWASSWSKVVVSGEAIAKERTLELTSSEASHGATLYVTVEGELDGTAALIIPDSEADIELGPGRVSKSIEKEFYTDEAEIKYKPGTARNGKLVIRYRY